MALEDHRPRAGRGRVEPGLLGGEMAFARRFKSEVPPTNSYGSFQASQQLAQVVVADHRDLAFGHLRRAHSGERLSRTSPSSTGHFHG
jgi:hypothetical protein